MRTKIGLVLVMVAAVAAVVGLAGAQEPPQEKPVPPGMVAVLAGEFTMGMSVEDGLKECKKLFTEKCKPEAYAKEEPAHQVFLDAYYLDKNEVAQEEYDKCVAAGKCKANEKNKGLTGPRQPVVGVTWDDASNYCAWSGKRLPTEAEWEKAARGADGRMYPWGNELDGKIVNFCDKKCEFDWALNNWNDGYEKTAPVGNYPAGASPYGALDLAGNAAEWVADWYQDDYYRSSPAKNPKGPDTGAIRVWRGGSWFHDADYLRASDRNAEDPATQNFFLGFRCAGD